MYYCALNHNETSSGAPAIAFHMGAPYSGADWGYTKGATQMGDMGLLDSHSKPAGQPYKAGNKAVDVLLMIRSGPRAATHRVHARLTAAPKFHSGHQYSAPKMAAFINLG